MSNNLRAKIGDISRNKRISGTLVELLRGLTVVRLGDGRLLKGLKYVGGPLIVGTTVYVDYSSGTPIVHAAGDEAVSEPLSQPRPRSTSQDPDLPEGGNTTSYHTHTESQIIDIVHNAESIQGAGVVAPVEANDGMTLVYNHGTGGMDWEDFPTSLDDLTDVDTSTVAPVDGDALVWSEADGAWIPGEVAGGAGGHVIQDDGAGMTARANLNFVGATVTDDEANDATVITITASDTHYEILQDSYGAILTDENGEILYVEVSN